MIVCIVSNFSCPQFYSYEKKTLNEHAFFSLNSLNVQYIFIVYITECKILLLLL